MHLRTDTDAKFLEPDAETIEKVIRGLLQNPDESFAVLEPSEEYGDFMEVSPGEASTFRVEYGTWLDGTTWQYYAIDNIPIEAVVRLFQSCSLGEASWKNDYPW